MKLNSNWSKYLLELLVVFMGVTAAFLLDGWRQNRTDRQLEQQYLQSFYRDLRSDMENLQTVIPSNQFKLKRVQTFLSLNDPIDLDSVKTILADMMSMEFFDKNISTYESIKNSGNLNNISDYALKEDMVKYYEKFKLVDKVELVYQDWLNLYAIPYVYENMDIVRQEFISPDQIKGYQFKNTVAGYYALLSQNLEVYQAIAESNRDLLNQLPQKTQP